MFSASEKEILKILGRRKMTISDLTKAYTGTQQQRLDTQNYVASAVRRIKRKCDFYKLPWTLEGQGAGRAGRTVWKEAK